MLTQFTCEKTFCETRITLHVDCSRYNLPKASATVTHKRRIVRLYEFTIGEGYSVRTPEGADAWLAKNIEQIHEYARRDVLRATVAA